MKIILDKKELTQEKIDEWKMKRIYKGFQHLKKKIDKSMNMKTLESELFNTKMSLSYDEIYSLLKYKLIFADIVMKLACFISGKKRRSSIIEISEVNLNAKYFSTELDKLMLEDSDINKQVNLSACPEHYVLRAQKGILEVIETPGNSPMPTRFYITFEDETNILEPRDMDYKYQSVGVARLKDGTIIGGVRHQFKDTEKGLKTRFCVEFPSSCPRWLIYEHQIHLAVEWSYWIDWIKQNESTAT